MSWVVMSDGTEVDMEFPCTSTINMEHIPHHLATINRFTGGAFRPYSVAEHSLLVCEIAERIFGLDVYGRLAALMHDAHEAYTSDLHSPGKRAVGRDWHVFEARFEKLVQRRFSLVTSNAVFANLIKQADLIALQTERAQLLPATNDRGVPLRDWPCLTGIETAYWVDLMDDTRSRMTWQDWRQAFADRFGELDYERSLRITMAHEGTPA